MVCLQGLCDTQKVLPFNKMFNQEYIFASLRLKLVQKRPSSPNNEQLSRAGS